MLAIADKVITGIFVGILGTIWLFTRRYEAPFPYRILVYDRAGQKTYLSGIRVCFRTHAVAVSFAAHYKNAFPEHDFVLKSCIPRLTRIRILKRNHM